MSQDETHAERALRSARLTLRPTMNPSSSRSERQSLDARPMNCPTCHAGMVYLNGAKVGTPIGQLAPPMNPNGAGRNRTLVCDSVRRTGEHLAPQITARMEATSQNATHALSFAVCRSVSFVIADSSQDPDERLGGRTYVFLVNDINDTWHGYVTPEVLAVLRHLAGSLIIDEGV